MNHAPAIEKAVPEVFASVGKNYGRQVDEAGVAWPPRKDNLPHPLLILSGAMLEASTGGIGSYVRFTRDSAELGIREQIIPYALVHHYGTRPGTKPKIPRRRFFYLNAEERENTVQKFGETESREFRKQVL